MRAIAPNGIWSIEMRSKLVCIVASSILGSHFDIVIPNVLNVSGMLARNVFMAATYVSNNYPMSDGQSYWQIAQETQISVTNDLIERYSIELKDLRVYTYLPMHVKAI